MPKFHKVKRYKKIYRAAGPRDSFKAVLTVVGVVALAVLGWGLYGPVSRFLNGEITAEEPVSTVQSSQPQPPESSEEASQPQESTSVPEESSQPESSSEPSEPVSTVPVGENGTHGVYMPTSVLLDSGRRGQFLDSLEGLGMDTVFFDLKESTGLLTYRSQVETAVQAGAVPAGGIDLPAVVQELKGRGYKAVGRIQAFRDPLASAADKDLAVHYAGTEWSWLDNSRELGGKTWLNPFSAQAQEYVTALVEEAADAGVAEIMLDSVHFPVGFALEKADFGQTADNAARQRVLGEFVRKATAAGTAKGARVSLYLPVTAALGSEVERYGGNPINLADQGITIGVMPSLFGNAYSAEELVLADPVKSPYATVSQALEKALPKLPQGVQCTMLIQAYTATNVDPLHNMEYTAAQVADQIRAGHDRGCDDYLLFNPQGNYTLR